MTDMSPSAGAQPAIVPAPDIAQDPHGTPPARVLPRLSANFLVVTFLVHLAVSLLVMSDVLLASQSHWIVGQTGQDTTSYNMPQGQFIEREMRAGRLPLWNPYLFCGLPLLGNFNSALFYPLTWLHTAMNVESTWNWNATITFALAATFMTWWMKYRGIGPVGSMVAGFLFAWTGPLFAHLWPGHIQLIDSGSWMPLVMLSIDGILRSRKLRWAIVGAGGVGLQLLGGFPQAVYITGLVAVGYCLLVSADELIRLWRGQSGPEMGQSIRHWLRLRLGSAGLCCIVFLGGVMLGAVQLLPGLHANEESVRSQSVTYEFASTGRNAPSNILQTIAPRVYGDFGPQVVKDSQGNYITYPPLYSWFKDLQATQGTFVTFPWEAQWFIGASTLVLAVIGLVRSAFCRQGWVFAIMAIVMVFISFGASMPGLNHFLFDHLPGFTNFRSTGRFLIPFVMLLAVLVATGIDDMGRKVPLWAMITAGASIVVVAGLSFYVGGVEHWRSWLSIMASQADALGMKADMLKDDTFVAKGAANAATQLRIACIPLALLAGVLVATRFWKPAIWGLLLVTTVDVGYGVLAYRYRGRTDFMNPGVIQFYQQVKAGAPGGRALFSDPTLGNIGMQLGYPAACGYEPILPKRMAEYLLGSQLAYAPPMENDKKAELYNKLNMAPQIQLIGDRNLPYVRLMRVAAYAGPFVATQNGQQSVVQGTVAVPGPAPRLMLLTNYLVRDNRELAIGLIGTPPFDPMSTVILENEPAIKPVWSSTPQPTPTLVRETTDMLEIEADLTSPALLVVTDTYSKGWSARSVGPAPQEKYEIIPAYYAFRAVPLAAGKHHLVMEYVPEGYLTGLRLTMVGWAGWLICIAVLIYRQFFRSTGRTQAAFARINPTILTTAEPSPFQRKDPDE